MKPFIEYSMLRPDLWQHRKDALDECRERRLKRHAELETQANALTLTMYQAAKRNIEKLNDQERAAIYVQDIPTYNRLREEFFTDAVFEAGLTRYSPKVVAAVGSYFSGVFPEMRIEDAADENFKYHSEHELKDLFDDIKRLAVFVDELIDHYLEGRHVS